MISVEISLSRTWNNGAMASDLVDTKGIAP